MAKSHLLDSLARGLLAAIGQLPDTGSIKQKRAARKPNHLHQDQVERDLLALKLEQNPSLRLATPQEVRHAAALGWSLDVNRATAADWMRLPGCTPSQIDLLLRLQAGGVQLSGIDDLQRLLKLDFAQIECWQPLLVFRWYGNSLEAQKQPTIAINQAVPQQLEQELRFSQLCIAQLLRQRARQPFLDLADLQQRLQLPPDVVEGMIGRVTFEPGPAGPTLPL